MATRRNFIKCCSVMSVAAAAGFSKLGLINAFAQGVTDYRALVCIFLFGGNDGNNLIVPLDSPTYTNYSNARGGQTALPIAQAALLPVLSGNYGLHPSLPEMQSLMNQGRVAVLANTGPLVFPITRAQYQARSIATPSNLFSHSDQQAEWQTSLPSAASSGWAGRIADRVNSLNSPSTFPMVLSVAGTAIFCNGVQSAPASVTPSSGNVTTLAGFGGTDAATTARMAAINGILNLNANGGPALLNAADSITRASLAQANSLNTALQGQPALASASLFPNTSIGNQLLQIARIIQARNSVDRGMHRQVFFASIGGFDTHSAQLPQQQNLFSQLSPAMNAFYNATVELGVNQQVTTFTLSDFGRTLQPGSNGGSDHGWGSHHMIMGGAVHGNAMYGDFPTIALGGPNDASSNGRWIPTRSVDQYGATLAAWFGVSDPDLDIVFPNLRNFPTRNLGFI